MNKKKEAELVNRLLIYLQVFLMPMKELAEVRKAITYLLLALKDKILSLILRNYKILKLRARLDGIKSYKEYEQIGLALDTLQEKDVWKEKKESSSFDWKSIDIRTKNMRNLRYNKDIVGLVRCLR